MIYGLEKEAFLLLFNKLSLFSQDNHFIRKSQRMTRLGFNDSEEPYIHRVLRSKHCHVFFCVSSSLKDLLSHLIYSFCLIPSHPLNSAVPISTGKGGLHLQNYCISLYPHGFPPLYDTDIYLPSRHSFSTTQPLPGNKQLWFTCSQ